MRKKNVETITYRGSTLAIILYHTYRKAGAHFLTPEKFSLQLGFISHKKGEIIQAHIHRKVRREIPTTKEALIVKKGKVKINFYDTNKNFLISRILKAGDSVLLVKGGHGFLILEDAQIIEVKQGPYISEKKDKIKFEGVETYDSSKSTTLYQ